MNDSSPPTLHGHQGPKVGQVVIVRGLPGVGKSTVADILRERLRPAVRVNEDTMRYLALPRDLTDGTIVPAQLAGADLALSYALGGATAIIDGVLADPDLVDTIHGRIEGSGVPCRTFTITAVLADLLRRNRSRDPLVRLPDERIRLLHEGYRHDVGTLVRTEDTVAEETADNICQILADEPGSRSTDAPSAGMIVFMRHGATDIDTTRYPDHSRLGLSPIGRQQVLAARAGVARLAPTALISSPLPRALETARLLDDVLGLGVQIDERLAERTFPSLYGHTYDMVVRQLGEESAGRLVTDCDDLDLDGSETLVEARSRVRAAAHDWLTRSGQRLLVVSHGGPHGWLLSDLVTGRTSGDESSPWRQFTLGHARLTCLSRDLKRVLAVNISADDAAALAR